MEENEIHIGSSDPIVYTLTGQENGEYKAKTITLKQLRDSPIGTTYAVGDEKSQSSEKITLYATSGNNPGGIGVLIEAKSPFITGGKSITAAWISDNEPVRYHELTNNQTIFTEPPKLDLTSAAAKLLQAYDRYQEKIDVLNQATSEAMQEKILDKIHKEYLTLWNSKTTATTKIILFKDQPYTEDKPSAPTDRSPIQIAELAPVNHLQEMMKIKRISCRDLIIDAVTGGDELLNTRGMNLTSQTADQIYHWLQQYAKAGGKPDLKQEGNARKIVHALAPYIEKDLDRWHLEKSSEARWYLRKKYLNPFLEKADELRNQYVKEQNQIDLKLSDIPELPKMKRMAFEIRCQAFTRNVEKDLTRYIKKTETYDLRKNRDDDYIVPKAFFQKIEKAALAIDPDWKKKVYRQISVQEEIGDESKYRVSIKKGLDPLQTICGSEAAIDTLKQLLRSEYLRQVQLEAESFTPENNQKRAELLLDTLADIHREEIVCHELSSPNIQNGEELRSYFQKDLLYLREQRDQLYADLQVNPGLKNERVFEKLRKEISNLHYVGDREVEKIEKNIHFNPYTRQAEISAKLIQNLADKYGIQTSTSIPGYTQTGNKVRWLVPPGDSPLKSLGINRLELSRQLVQEKRSKILHEIQEAIEHPQPEKSKKRTYSRSADFSR